MSRRLGNNGFKLCCDLTKANRFLFFAGLHGYTDMRGSPFLFQGECSSPGPGHAYMGAISAQISPSQTQEDHSLAKRASEQAE